MTLLVAGPEVEEQCHQLRMPLAAPLAEGWALPARPRCLNIEKGPQGFGFLLREEKGPDGRLGEWHPRRWVGHWALGWPYIANCMLLVSLRSGPQPPPMTSSHILWG